VGGESFLISLQNPNVTLARDEGSSRGALR
jgi:hypothetical protein